MKQLHVSAIALVLGLSINIGSAWASPTMIRLGYADCASCHLTPQGAGLLTAYGKGIDEAQSLRAREVVPSDTPHSRLLYDLRVVAGSQVTQRLAQSTIVNASTMNVMPVPVANTVASKWHHGESPDAANLKT